MFSTELLDALQAAAEGSQRSLPPKQVAAGVSASTSVKSLELLQLVTAHRAALDRIDRAEALHVPDSAMPTYCAECSDFGTDEHPMGQLIEHPCATKRALTEGEPSE